MPDNPDIMTLLADAWKHRGAGQYQAAQELVRKAQALCADDDYNALGRIFHVYAQIESDHDRLQPALEYYQRSRGQYVTAKNADKIAHLTRHIADLQRELGNAGESEARFLEAIALYEANAQSREIDLANAYYGYALLLKNQHKNPQAIAAWEAASRLYQAGNLQMGVDEANRNIELLRK